MRRDSNTIYSKSGLVGHTSSSRATWDGFVRPTIVLSIQRMTYDSLVTNHELILELIFSVDQIKWMDTKEQQEFVSRLYNEEDSKLTAEFEKEPGYIN